MEKFNYYKEELSKLDKNAPTISIVVSDFHGNKTKNMNLNSESLPEVITFLIELLAEKKNINNDLVLEKQK